MHLSVGVHLNSGKKSVPYLVKIFFFYWSSPEFGEKKDSILEDLFLFFGLHLNFGGIKCSIFGEDLFLVFT